VTQEPTDLREERARSERALAIAVAVFLLVIGSAAIAMTYGSRALILGSACLLAGVLVFALLWGILTLMERF